MFKFLCVLATTVLFCAAQQPGGKGPATRAAAPRLKVVAEGRIVVTADDRVNYAWVAKKNGAGEAPWIKTYESGEWFVIESWGGGEVTVNVPRLVRDARLESRSGTIRALYLGGDVSAVTPAGSVELDEIGGNVQVRTGGGSVTLGTVRGWIRCMSGGGMIRADRIGGDAVLETSGGEIYVGEAGGPLRLSTVGNIHVNKAVQGVVARTASGIIEVEESGGMVTAETAGGGIRVGTARGARCESSSGSIRLGRVSGSVRASTASGNLYVGFAPDQLLEASFLAAERGDITALVPSNLAVTVKAVNESPGWFGRVVSEFPQIRLRPAEGFAARPVVAEGSLNGGGPTLMLSASQGSIYLRRQR